MILAKARGRGLAAAVGALLVLGAAVLGLGLRDRSGSLPPRAAGDRPALMLLTSLPIAFGEEFTLDSPQSPALEALRSRYEVKPISVADSGSLGAGELLLMAQPLAQPAELLVELDRWVRGGGRVLLLADPLLEWPSERPLGDVLRPPPAFADTGLLGHWGLRLDAPDSPGPVTAVIDGRPLHALSPGTLARTGQGCDVESSGLLARCRIGRGQAVVIADADFADVDRRGEPERSDNLAFLLAELARLEQ